MLRYCSALSLLLALGACSYKAQELDLDVGTASTLAVDKDSANADGVERVTVTLSLKHHDGTAAPGLRVQLRVSDPNDALVSGGTAIDPNGALTTDANGRVTASFTSKDAGVKVLTGNVLYGSQAVALRNASVTFTVPSSYPRLYIDASNPNPTAGDSVSVTLTVVDALGAVQTGYLGTILLSASDANATVPEQVTLAPGDAGVKVVPGVVFKGAGTRYLTGTDAALPALTGQARLVVQPAAATGFQVSVSGSPTAGQAAGITVTAVDAYNNVVPSYVGQVTITANDPNNTNGVPSMAGPLSPNFTTTDQGQITLPGVLTLQRTNNQVTLTVTGPSAGGAGAPLSSTRGPFTVMPAAADHLELALNANSVNAGGNLLAQVQAHDVFENLVTAYAGTVRVGASDTRAVLPPLYTFNPSIDAGQHSFTLSLNTPNPNAVVTAQDANGAPPAAASATVTVLPVGPYLAGVWTSTSNNTATAGSAQALTVHAYNVDGSAMTGYSGTVALTSTDPNAVLNGAGGSPITMTAGVGVASNLILTTAGAQYVTLADTQNPNMAGSSHVLTVTPGPAARYVLAGGNAIAGTPYPFSITAKDAYGNTATGYTGRADLTTTDTRAVVTNHPFNASDAGVVQATMLFKTAGVQTLNANDSVAGGNINGSLVVNVAPGAPGNFVVRLDSNQLVAGHATGATVDVRDSYGNATPSYTGTLAWRSTNANAVLPPNYTFTASDAGSHTFANALVFYAAGNSVVYASDTNQSTINGAAGVTISPDATSRLTFVGPASRLVAGVAFQVVLTATDQYGNTTPNAGVTIHYSSDDPNSAGLPADAPLSATGQQTNSIKLFTAGARTLNANVIGSMGSMGSASIAAASITFGINPGDANTFVFTNMSASYVAGQPLGFTVNARDLYGNTATGYAGTVLLTSTDSAFTSGQYTFTSTDVGSHAFTNSLHTAGNQNVLVQDSTTPGLKGLLTMTVLPGAASTFVFHGLADAAAGTAQNCNLVAVDPYGNRATSYTGTVSLTSTDPNAVLPAAYPYGASDAGRHPFSGITFKTASAQTLFANDGTLNGNITVNIKNAPATLLRFSGNPNQVTAGALFSARVTAYDPYNNVATDFASSVSFSVSPSGSNAANLAVPYTYSASDAGTHNNPNSFSLNVTPQMTLTATSSSSSPITGSITLPVQAGNANGFIVSGLSQNANAGTPMNVTVRVVDNFNNTVSGYTGTVAFNSNDTNPLTVLPSSRTFLASDNGTFTITNGVKLTKAQSGAYVRVTDVNASAITGAQTGITIKGLAATQLVASGIADPTTAGVTQQFTLSATDPYNNVDATKSGNFIPGTANSSDPDALLPSGPYNFASGIATASGLQLRTGGLQSVNVSAFGLSPRAQTVTVVANPNVSRIAFDPNSVPATQTSCAAISPAVRVLVLDNYNNVIASNANTIQMNAQNGNLFGTNKQPVQSGAASFGDLSLDSNGTTRLHATLVGGSFSADSNVIAVSGSSTGPSVVLSAVSATSSCVDLQFTVSACGAPVLLQPRYANPASPTNPNLTAATVASSSAAGLYGVPSSRAISLRWDSVRDVGHRNGNYNFDIGAQVGSGIVGHASTVLTINNAPTWAVKTSTGPGASIQSLAVADFDRDGTPDTVAVDGNVVMVWLANGGVTQQSFSGGVAPSRVAAGDINRDGIPDAVVCAGSSSSNTGVYYLLGKADGSLSAPAQNAAFSACGDLALADVNHDGILDAITFDTSTSRVLWASAAGGAVKATPLGFTPQGRPVPADVTGDGNVDLVLLTDASNNSNTVALLVGTGAGFSAPVTTKPPGNALPLSSIAAGDVDNNGTVDLVLSSSTGYWVYDAMSASGFGRSANAPITGRAADSALLADADGDGYLDLFARSSNGLTVYAGAPIAQDFNSLLFTTSLSSPAAFALADLNHDALVDVVTNEGKLLERWVNQMPRSCDGVRFGATLATATATMPSGLASADFDRDGKFDVAIAHAANSANGNNALEVFRGDGAGGLTLKASNLGSNANILYGLPAAGDLNGDSLVDLAVPGIASGGSANVWVFAGDGNGNFGAGTAYGVDPNAGQVAIADFNGDGRSDMLVTTSNPNTLDLLLAPNFNKQTLTNLGMTPSRVIVGSVTTNKRADVVAYNPNGYVVLVNDGTGNFSPAANMPRPVTNLGGVAVALLDTDARPDLAVADSNDITVYFGQDDMGTFDSSNPNQVSRIFCVPGGLAAADIDRANGPDLVMLCESAPTGLAIIYNDGTGNSVRNILVPTPGGLADVAIRDMSGDGYPDILTLSQNANTLDLALDTGLASTGNDFYTSNFDYVNLDPNTQGAALADINGDGVLDAVVGNANNAAVHIRLGQLTGALGLSQSVGPSGQPQSVCTADIDNDGDQDILAGDFGRSSVVIERNLTPRGSPNPNFSNSGVGSVSSNANVTALAVGDINNDGKPDAVAGMLSGFAVYLNIGTGNVTTAQADTVNGSADPTSGVAVGDINGDGWQDVVISSASVNTVTIWYNDGAGNLGNTNTLSMTNAPTGVAVGDINNDGKLDIVVALAGGPRTQLGVITNQGNNNFALATVDSGITPSGGVMAADVVLVDINQDGKLDALVPSLRDYGLVAFTGQGITGTNAFLASTSFVSLGSALRSLAVGDMNHDGRPDLLLVDDLDAEMSMALSR